MNVNHFQMRFVMKETIQLWGYLHDYGNPQMNDFSMSCHFDLGSPLRSGSLARYRGATESFAHGEDNPVRRGGWRSWVHEKWIGSRENLRETMFSHGFPVVLPWFSYQVVLPNDEREVG